MTRTPDMRSGESGFALMFAIVMMVLILGFLAVFTVSSVMSRDERQTERGRMQSEVWSDAAASAIAARLESGELGYRVTSGTVGTTPGRVLYPQLAGTTAAHGTSSCAPSFPITTSTGGSGWYCVRPPAAGLPAGTGFLNLSPTDPEHGSIRFVVRAWGTQGAVRPIDVELTFGRPTLSRFAVLSDAPIWLDRSGPGSLVLPAGARLHSNNTSNSANGIYLRGAVNIAGASRITATRASSGTAVSSAGGAPSCPNGNKCYVSGKTVSFNSTYTLFNRIQKADPGATCASPFRMCRVASSSLFPAPTAGTMPMFAVNVSGACVTWSRTRFPLRTDSLSYPIVDDSQLPTNYGGGSTICPETGGGAVMFEGDVLLTGTRPAGAPPVTILARRPQNVSQSVTLPGSGNRAQVTEAASIYLLPAAGPSASGTLGGSGTGPTQSALGVVAEGGVYIPTSLAAGTFRIQKASIIAAGSGFSLGPSFQQVAGDTGVVDQTGTEISAGGIDPCSPSAALPAGGSFTFSGTFASRQVPFLSYVKGACTRGYASRTYQFDTELGWNPPPFFPASSPWHLVDSRVFNT